MKTIEQKRDELYELMQDADTTIEIGQEKFRFANKVLEIEDPNWIVAYQTRADLDFFKNEDTLDTLLQKLQLKSYAKTMLKKFSSIKL
jgi:Mg2+/Co2+ transporter CorC